MNENQLDIGLIIPVPEAERLVLSYRTDYDPSAALGVPAHITINYPFRSFQPGDQDIINRLQDIFSTFEAFEHQLVELRRFPLALYLATHPEQPFIDLSLAIAEHFPDSLPYEGRFETIVPHLTIADVEDQQLLAQLQAEISRKAERLLPIKSRASEVWLMDNRKGYWHTCHKFSLSPCIA